MRGRIICLIVLFAVCSLSFGLADTSLAESTLTPAQKVNRFLRITGFGLESCTVVDLNESTCAMPNSPHRQTDVLATINLGQGQWEAHITLIDGNVWMYSLSGEFGEDSRTPSDCLARADMSLRGYQAFVNKPRYNQLVEILPPVATSGKVSIKDGNLSLEISSKESCSTSQEYAEYVVLRYSREVGGHPIPGDFFSMSISKSGILTDLVDNTMCPVATAINLLEEEATSIALPYIETYARRNGQETETVEATLEYVRDVGCFHGDNLAYYPQWRVCATYDKVSDERVSKYAVLVWADDGQAYHHGPQGYYDSPSANSANLIWQCAVAAVAVFAALSVLAMAAKRRSATRRKSR